MARPSLSTRSTSITPPTASSDSYVGDISEFRKTHPGDAGFLRRSTLVPSSVDISSHMNTDTATAVLPGAEYGGQPQQECTTSRGEDKKLLSDEEILRRRSKGEALVVVDGNVYNVTEFLETHPGGAELILEHLKSDGVKDAGPVMRGKVVHEDGHSHSEAAFHALEQFFVGPVKTAPCDAQSEAREAKQYCYTVDLTKPIVAQVGYLGADYDHWVHDSIVGNTSPRFFESDISEFLTKTKWWVIPLIWVPVGMIMLYIALVIEKVPLYLFPGHLVFGVLFWTLEEYLLHRYLFHMKTSSYWGNTVHYVLHGFHHKHPMDGSRLVFPPAFTLILGVVIWFLIGNWIVPYPAKLITYASALWAYVAYDLTHYYLHFGNPFNEETRKLKRFHMNHHFKDHKTGYGITSSLWDSLLGTHPNGKISVDET